MSYLAHLTVAVDQPAMHDVARRVLATVGLYTSIVGNSGAPSSLPQYAFAGKFEGSGASKIRDDLYESVRTTLAANQVHAECFLSVGGDTWAWKRFRT